MNLVSSAVTALAVAFVVLAALVSLVSVGVLVHVAVTHRRVRRVRRQSIGSYYRDLALGR